MGLADVLNRITGFMSTLGLIGVPLMFGTGWNIPIAGLLLLIFAPTSVACCNSPCHAPANMMPTSMAPP